MAEGALGRTLYLVDGTSNIFRAFYAIRGLTSPSGRPTNATFGFTQMLRKLLQEQHPEFIAVAFDRPEPTHRHELFPTYKANRQAPPEDLVDQIPDIEKVCRVLGVPTVELAGYEADDLMATLARKATAEGFRVILVSSDKDLLQLVGDTVSVLHPSRGELLDREGVKRRFGVFPEQVVDVLALMGDASDNVPGVPGIGEKGARELVATYGNLEECLRHASEISRKTYRENLLKYQGQARMSRDLVTVHRDVPVEWALDRYRRREPTPEEARRLFQELGFSKLAEEIGQSALPEDSQTPPPSRELIVKWVHDHEELKDIVKQGVGHGHGALMPILSSAEPMRAGLLGMGISVAVGAAYFVPLDVRKESGLPGVSEEGLVESLKGFLENPEVAKLSEDLKSLQVYLLRRGVKLQGGKVDTTLIAYLLDPEGTDYSLERLEASLLAQSPLVGPPSALLSSWEKRASQTTRACQVLLELEGPLIHRLREKGLDRLYRELELPLTSVLAEMEYTGVRIDSGFLNELGVKWKSELREIEARIHTLAGMEFNIQSPRQLGRVLFEKLGLTPGRRTEKVKSFSTGVDVMESLANSHPLPAAVLEYRSLSKLLSTYVEALPDLVNPETGRVHASFNQTAAATGRLSSSDPNLQNIPNRTDRGKRIRKAFIAQEGWLILTADYSQIELRVLAHLAKDEEMIDAFRSGEDIHRRTAAEVLGVAPGLVTPQMRHQAKAINFGILYGMGPFRLSRELGVSQAAAKRYIEEYFQRFRGVKRYIEQVVQSAEQTGAVSTLFGRIRPVPEIKSRNVNQRNQGVRVAVNTTVQGTAADLIKMAMLQLDRRLKKHALRSRLLIQVHDELVLEVPETELAETGGLVRESMEGCCSLEVPLVAEVHSGSNWLDTK